MESYEVTHCLYDYLTIKDVMNYRCISRLCHVFMKNVCEIIECVSLDKVEYYNMFGIVKLFPRVNFFHNVGHRGNIFDEHIITKINRLWVDSHMSMFSFWMLRFYNLGTIRHLTLSLHSSWAILHSASILKWSGLKHLYLHILSTSSTTPKPMTWSTPNLERVYISHATGDFPFVLKWLPIHGIDELAIMSSNMQPSFVKWFFSLLCVSASLRVSSVSTLRLYNMLPESSVHISVFIEMLNSSNVTHLQLHPCFPETALTILTSTEVVLTISNAFVGIHFLRLAFPTRIRLVNS